MGKAPNQFHFTVLDDFIGQHWQLFINFIAVNHDMGEVEAEDLAEDISTEVEFYAR